MTRSPPCEQRHTRSSGLRLLLIAGLIALSGCLSSEWSDRGFVRDAEGGTPKRFEAKPWIDAGFSPSDAKQWRSAGFDSRQALSFKSAGYNPSEAREWCSYDFCEPAQASQWKRQKFTAPEADAWSLQTSDPQVAKAWRGAGLVNPATMPDWIQSGFDPESAMPWLGEGFVDPNVVLIWKESGFPPGAAGAWAKHNFLPEATKPWLAVGVNAAQAAEMHSLGVKPEQAVRYVWLRKKGFKPSQVAPWVSEFDEQEAYKWLISGFGIEDARTYRKADFLVQDALPWHREGVIPDEAIEWERQEFTPAEAKVWKSHGISALKASLWRFHGYSGSQALALMDCAHPELAKELQKKSGMTALCKKYKSRLEHLGELAIIDLDQVLHDLLAWEDGCLFHGPNPDGKRVAFPPINVIEETRRFLYRSAQADGQPYFFDGKSFREFYVEAKALNDNSFVHRNSFRINQSIAGYFKPTFDKRRLILSECLP